MLCCRGPMALAGILAPSKITVDEGVDYKIWICMALYGHSLCMGQDSVITPNKVIKFGWSLKWLDICRMQGFEFLSGIHASSCPMLAPFRCTLPAIAGPKERKRLSLTKPSLPWRLGAAISCSPRDPRAMPWHPNMYKVLFQDISGILSGVNFV